MREIDLEDLANNTKKALSRDLPKPTAQDVERLAPLIYELLETKEKLREREFLKLKRKYKFDCRKPFLFHVFLEMKKEGLVPGDRETEERIRKHLQIKAQKSWSGIVTITVFTAAFPEYTNREGERVRQEFSCQFDCAYCPKQPGQPRSYIDAEPGVLRANRNGFDCALQMWDRMTGIYMTGNLPLDGGKCEIIVSGGTWTSYPVEYRKEFCRDIYYAANVFWDGDEKREERFSLEEEKKLNQHAKARIIGITIETRPDTISAMELRRLREYGVTRVQLGIQHIDDEVLKKVNRQCTTRRAEKAIKMLKENGFKIDAHWMPNLPGSSVESDRHMLLDVLLGLKSKVKETVVYERVGWKGWLMSLGKCHREVKEIWEHWDIATPELSVDYWKLYPTAVTPWTDIEKWYKDGTYVQYGEKEMIEMFLDLHKAVYPFLRLNRIIRDIPETHIYNIGSGSDNTNMRQELNDYMRKCGIYSMDIRNREVKGALWDGKWFMVVRCYHASMGEEYFISAESRDKKTLYGFVRLRLDQGFKVFSELEGCALVRELRCYGNVSSVGEMGSNVQHQGIGKRLMKRAEDLALEKGYKKVAVIAGEGTKPYYKKIGYYEDGGEGDFMIKLLY